MDAPMEHAPSTIHPDAMLLRLEDVDNTQAYKALLELEHLSETSSCLIPYMDSFLSMTASTRYAVRVRGFRLLLCQARWDEAGFLDKNLDAALGILADEKPTAVRQALAALRQMLPHKPQLYPRIRDAVQAMDLSRYPDTMRGLIAKDIAALLRER